MGHITDAQRGLAAFLANPDDYYATHPVCERLAIAEDATRHIAELESENERLRDQLEDLRAFVAVLDGARAAISRDRSVVCAEHHPS